jgi:hypothetical protein
LGINNARYEDQLNSDNSDSDSVSLVSSVSSCSSSESSGSTLDSLGDFPLDLESEREALHQQHYQAIRAHIQRLENTRVVHPHRVDKLSQLYLVLENYKADDEKRFRRNLRVSASTFDSLVKKIEDHWVFLSEGSVPDAC